MNETYLTAVYCKDLEGVVGLVYNDNTRVVYDQPIKCRTDRDMFKVAISESSIIFVGSNTAKAMDLNVLVDSDKSDKLIVVVTQDLEFIQELESVYNLNLKAMSIDEARDLIKDSKLKEQTMSVIGGSKLIESLYDLIDVFTVTKFETYSDFYINKIRERDNAKNIKEIKIKDESKDPNLRLVYKNQFECKDQYDHAVQASIEVYVRSNHL